MTRPAERVTVAVHTARLWGAVLFAARGVELAGYRVDLGTLAASAGLTDDQRLHAAEELIRIGLAVGSTRRGGWLHVLPSCAYLRPTPPNDLPRIGTRQPEPVRDPHPHHVLDDVDARLWRVVADADPGTLAPLEVAERADLPRTVAYRRLATLRARGLLVVFTGDPCLHVGPTPMPAAPTTPPAPTPPGVSGRERGGNTGERRNRAAEKPRGPVLHDALPLFPSWRPRDPQP